MKKINEVAHNRLMIQVSEARELGLEKMAAAVLKCVTAETDEKLDSYSSLELERDLYEGLWKLAMNVVAYHDSKQVDASKVDETISKLATVLLTEVESSLGVSGKVGALEPKLPGEKE